MEPRRKKRELVAVVALPVLALLSSALLALTLTTSTTPYSIYNSGDSGLSSLYKASKLVVWSPKDIERLDPERHALIVFMARKPGNETIRELLQWVSRGGSIMVLDEKGYSNPLLRGLGLPARIEGHWVYDPLRNAGSREDPLTSAKLGDREFRLVFHTVASLTIEGENSGLVVLARTSILSYTDLDDNGYYSFSDTISSKPLVVVSHRGKSTTVVVPDLDFLSNYCSKKGDNLAFTRLLFKEKSIVLYSGLNNMSRVDLLKYTYYSSIGFLGVTAARLSLLLLLVFSAALVGVYEAR